MSREIKFRAWIEKENKMVDVSSLDFDDCGWPNWNSKQRLIEVGYRKNNTIDLFSRDMKQVVLMQFTGLRDKNGAEIYEHDIIKVDDDWDSYGFASGIVNYVIFHDGSFKLTEGGIFKPKYRVDNGITEGGNVIGNIYETPELIK